MTIVKLVSDGNERAMYRLDDVSAIRLKDGKITVYFRSGIPPFEYADPKGERYDELYHSWLNLRTV